jgi:hypothetical protein
VQAAGWTVADLNAVVPDSYRPDTFRPTGPRPLSGEPVEPPPALAHPVVDDAVFLQSRFALYWRTGAREELAQDLDRVDALVRLEFEDRLPRLEARGRPEDGSRVAVLLRTHLDNPTVRQTLAVLQAGAGYDLRVLAHEEPGRSLNFDPTPKMTHALKDFRDHGFAAQSPNFLMHCADLLFGYAQERLPDHDWLVMVENDVAIRDPSYFSRLATRLAALPAGALDLAIPRLNFSHPSWMWHPGAARVFPRVLGSFFPVVAISARAARSLWSERLKERAQARNEDHTADATSGVMFCEAFTPSAAWAAGLRVDDLNNLVPDSYASDSFNVGPPRLLSAEPPGANPALAHPVLHDRDFLEKRLAHDRRTGRVEAFIADLEARTFPSLPPALVEEFLGLCQTERRPRKG